MSHDHDHCHTHDHKHGCCHEEPAHNECCHHHHDDECCEHEDFAEQLLELADDAWMEVLHEKIKAQIEATSGKHLDKLAKIVADANKSRWQHKLENQGDYESYKAEVAAFFKKKG